MKQIQYSNKSGITLLEVLISMGILAIGIVSTLALMPAGGSYLRRAKIENHSAALVHNAYNTATAAGLFRTDALFMEDKIKIVTDGESPKEGFPLGLEGFVPKDGTQTISLPSGVLYYDYEGSPKLSNELPVTLTDDEDQERAVIITMKEIDPSNPDPTEIVQNVPLIEIDPDDENWEDGKEFSWEFTQDLDLANNFDVNAAGDPTDWNKKYYDKWSFEVEHDDDDVAPLEVKVDLPPNSNYREPGDAEADGYRRYLARPYKVNRSGQATVRSLLSDSENQSYKNNQSRSNATVLNFPNSEFTTLRVQGELWRYETGYRVGGYTRQWNLENKFIQALAPPEGDLSWVHTGALGVWTDSSGDPKANDEPDAIKEDGVDWFKTRVRSGAEVRIDFSRTNEEILNYSLESEGDSESECFKFAVFLNDLAEPLVPQEGSVTAKRYTYLCEQAGWLYVKVQLQESLENSDNNKPYRLNTISNTLGGFNPVLSYEFDLEISGRTRIVAYDPLMRSHLHSIGSVGTELSSFANFNQIDDEENLVTFEIPRANWREVEEAAPEVGVALANRLCREDDTLRVELPDDEDLPSEQLFDAVSGVLARRQSTGDMSWMMTVQPAAADEIPLRTHWKTPGNFIDVAFVIFDKRFMPLSSSETDGAQDFLGSWSELTGTLDVLIPTDRNLEVADLKRMFPSNGWLMLAPRRYRDNQKIDWIQIHTCEFTIEANGIRASILPVSEPMSDAMNHPSLPDANGDEQVWVHVEQGITAVSRRFIQIE
ncbi:MAG: type IV pilus modification PilV family protein [Pirellulales bacterium]